MEVEQPDKGWDSPKRKWEQEQTSNNGKDKVDGEIDEFYDDSFG